MEHVNLLIVLAMLLQFFLKLKRKIQRHYILRTSHRDTHTWERSTTCTIFFIIYFT